MSAGDFDDIIFLFFGDGGFGMADSSRDEVFSGHRCESQAVSNNGNNRLEKIREQIKEFPTGPGPVLHEGRR